MTLYNFPTDALQTNGDDCGVPLSGSIITYCGEVAPRHDKMVKILGTDSRGTPLEGFMRLFDSVKLKHELRPDMALDELDELVDDGIPAILMVQGWKEWNGKPASWSKEWKSGHFVVCIDYNRQRMYFADPWKDPDSPARVKEGISFLYRSEFLDRWHDDDTDGTRYHNTGLVVYPKKRIIRPRDIIHMGDDYNKK